MTENFGTTAGANAKTVHQLYDYERRGDLDSWIALWNPNGKHTFPWGDGSSDVIGFAALKGSIARKFASRTNVDIREEVFQMADPCWVFAAVEVSVYLTDLKRQLQASIWCRFLFDTAGLILEEQEVFDSARITKLIQ